MQIDLKNKYNIASLILMLIGGIFFDISKTLAADESRSNCVCFNGTVSTPLDEGKNVIRTSVPGTDATSENNCHQLCSNEGRKIYIFRDNGRSTLVTKPKTNEAIQQTPLNECSCSERGGPYPSLLINRKAVNVNDECVFLCRNTEGATHYAFSRGDSDFTWVPIPALAMPAPSAQSPKLPTRFDYKLLESFPGFFSAGKVMTDLPEFILALYKFGIWTVGIAGLFMIVIGGFMYMASAGNNSTATSAKGIIWDSLIGIIAALSAYLFIYVINPELVKINLNLTPVEVNDVPALSPGEFVPLPGQLTDGEAKKRLQTVGIPVKPNACGTVTDSNCTTLAGIPGKAINGLIKLKEACPNCDFYVTGGTEGGHKTHGQGNPMIDVRYSKGVHDFLAQTKINKAYEQYGLTQVCTSAEDLNAVSYNRSYDRTCKDPSSQPHFHLSFGL